MKILALDLAIRSGFAFGVAGNAPRTIRSGVVVLKDSDDGREISYANLIAWLDERFRADRPDLVVKEAPLNLQGYRNLGNAAATVRITFGLHAVVEGVCARFRIRCEEAADATIRKHFIGRANCGSRAATKAAVVQRCHALGYMPREATSDDRADAIAIWDFAAATFGRRQPHDLVLFGEGRAA